MTTSTTTPRRFRRILTMTGAGLLAAAAVATPVAASAATVSGDSPTAAPGTVAAVVVDDDATPTPTDPGVTTPTPAGVSIVSAPSSWVRYVPMPMTLSSFGFSRGNWVNVWVTAPDGTRESQDGHFIRNTDEPKAFANFCHGPGTYQVQVSMGAWPEEQWSNIIDVQVG